MNRFQPNFFRWVSKSAAVLLIAAIFQPLFLVSCLAAGDATKCVATIKGVYFRKVTGEWVLVKDSSREADLLAEEPALSFINYNRVPSGKYVNVKIVLSETFKVTGKGGNNMTKQGGEITVAGTAIHGRDLPGTINSLEVTAPTWSDQAQGEIIEHLNLDFEDRNDFIEIFPRRNFEKPFRVKKGSAVHVWMTMSLNRTVYFAFTNMIKRKVPKENVMYFIPPDQIDELSITVDSASTFASGDEIEFNF